MTALPSWADQMKALEKVSDNLIAKWRPGGATEAETQDMNKLALSMLASGYLCRVYTDIRRPVFMPMWNYAFNQGGPSPDYVYSTVEIDPRGVYRISRLPGHHPVRRAHPAGHRHAQPAGDGGQRAVRVHQRPR